MLGRSRITIFFLKIRCGLQLHSFFALMLEQSFDHVGSGGSALYLRLTTAGFSAFYLSETCELDFIGPLIIVKVPTYQLLQVSLLFKPYSRIYNIAFAMGNYYIGEFEYSLAVDRSSRYFWYRCS